MSEWVDAKQELPIEEGSYLALCLLYRQKQYRRKIYRIVDIEDGELWLGQGIIRYPTILYWWRDKLPDIPPVNERTPANEIKSIGVILPTPEGDCYD